MKINFIPLTFIKSKEDLHFQVKNTLIMKNILNKFDDKRELKQLLKKTQYGFTASASEYGKYRLLRITDLKNGKVNWENVPFCDGDCKKYLLKKRDIVIARTGNNKSFLIEKVPENAVFASYLIRLEVDKELLPGYLYLFLNSYLFWSQVIKMQSGTAIPNVNAEKLKKLMIPYCSIKEQEKIIRGIFDSNLNKEIIKVEKILKEKEELSNEIDNQKIFLSYLKQSILQEAVSGKLVPQNPKDESASELLKKIKKEKEKLVKEGKIKKQKLLPPIEDDEIPYELPKGWVWCGLGDVCKKIHYGYTASAIKNSDGIKLLRITDIQNHKVKWEQVPSCQIKESEIDKYSLNENDILIARTGGTIGKSYLVKGVKVRSVFASYLIRAVPLINVNPNYLKLFLGSKLYWNQLFEGSMGTGQPNVNGVTLSKLKFSLPPLSEQKRIVAKVDELMKYCDELEGQIKDNKKGSELLMGAVLRESFENN